jgi:hypothetical protein
MRQCAPNCPGKIKDKKCLMGKLFEKAWVNCWNRNGANCLLLDGNGYSFIKSGIEEHSDDTYFALLPLHHSLLFQHNFFCEFSNNFLLSLQYYDFFANMQIFISP